MTATKTVTRTNTWTPEQLRILKKLFPNHPTAEVAEKVGKGLEAVKKRASRMGLTKSKWYRRQVLHHVV